MSDGISESYRASREEQKRIERRRNFLAAALTYLSVRTEAAMAEVCSTDHAIRSARRSGDRRPSPHSDSEANATEARKRFASLAAGDKAEWVNFLLRDVGIDDADMRRKCLEVSPFNGCIVILSRYNPSSGWELVGDTSWLVSTISSKGAATVEVVHEGAVFVPGYPFRDTRVHVYRVTTKK